MADQYGPQTPGVNISFSLHNIWQFDVPLINASVPDGCAPASAMPPAWASIKPLATITLVVNPNSSAAVAVKVPTAAPGGRISAGILSSMSVRSTDSSKLWLKRCS